MSANKAAEGEKDEDPIIEDAPEASKAAEPIKRDEMKQTDYYKKWDHFTAEQLSEMDEEEKAEKAAADKALGKDKAFESEAHKKDKTTHLALKEAKKLWDRRRDEEINQKHELCGLKGEKRSLTAADLGGKKVLGLKNLEDCELVIGADLGVLVKLFVEKCVRCKVTVAAKLITSHVEVSHCEAFELVVDEAVHTTQVDLSKGVLLRFSPGTFTEEHKVYSAGCLDLRVVLKGLGLESRNDYIADLAPLVVYTGTGEGGATSEVGKGSGAERKAAHQAARAAQAAQAAEEAAAATKARDDEARDDAHPLDADEADEADEGGGVGGRKVETPEEAAAADARLRVGSIPAENGGAGAAVEGGLNAGGGNAAQQSFSDPRSEEQHFITQLVPNPKTQALELVTEAAMQVGNRWATRRELDLETAQQADVTARELQENAHRAEVEKLSGNQAFGNAEYAQAAVHYTIAIDLANNADSQSTLFPQPVNPLIHACYSNRAACFLKLGQHEKALADADSCIAVAPDTFVKGHFRRGLALHAMGRYAEALPSLGKALRLENPKSKASVKQIEQAITFAERKLQVEMRARTNR